MGITYVAAADGRVLVRELARASGTRTRLINKIMPSFDGGPFDLETKVQRRGIPVRVGSNGLWLTVEVGCDSPFAVAVGRMDRILPADQPAGAVDGLLLYMMSAGADEDDRQAPVEWLERHVDVLRRVGLERGEGILIAQNVILAGLRPSPLEAFMQRLDGVIDLAEGLPSGPEADGHEGDTGMRMPSGLEALDDLATIWAIDDDADREELIDSASDAALKDLYARVRPHFATINELLDATDEQEPPELLTAGRLAEAAMEARIELSHRREQTKET